MFQTQSDSTEKIALITGATGFIGRHLTQTLLADGWEVHVLARSDSRLSILDNAVPATNVHLCDGSIDSLNRIFNTVCPKSVFHLASLFLGSHQMVDVDALVRTNIHFPAQLVEVMVRNGCHRLVNTGTSWQHFADDTYNPVNLYAATKQAFEDLLVYYTEATPLRSVTLKLFDTYGPGDDRPKLFNLLKRLAQTGETLAMSPGCQLLDMVHVSDVVNAFVIAGNSVAQMKPGTRASFAVSSGKLLSLRELVALFEELLGRKLSIHWGGRSYREREVMIPWRSGNSLPGWTAAVSLRDGIEGYIKSERLF